MVWGNLGRFHGVEGGGGRLSFALEKRNKNIPGRGLKKCSLAKGNGL